MTYSKIDIVERIAGDNGVIHVHKGLMKEIGLIPALLYGEIVSTYLYWRKQNRLTVSEEKGWFYCTIDDLESKTSIKKDTQNKAIKILEEEGLIQSKRIGLPAKRHFHVTEKYKAIFPYLLSTKKAKIEKPKNEAPNVYSKKSKTDHINLPAAKNDQKPCPIQCSEKSITGNLKNQTSIIVFSETNNKEFNNKQVTNKKINTINQDHKKESKLDDSIINQSYDLSEEVNQLIESYNLHTYKHRLTFRMVEKLDALYHKNYVSNAVYFAKLFITLKECKHDKGITKFMETALLNARAEQTRDTSAHQSYQKTIRSEVVPDWLLKQKEEEKAKEKAAEQQAQVIISEEDFFQQREQLQARLKAKYNKSLTA